MEFYIAYMKFNDIMKIYKFNFRSAFETAMCRKIVGVAQDESVCLCLYVCLAVCAKDNKNNETITHNWGDEKDRESRKSGMCARNVFILMAQCE